MRALHYMLGHPLIFRDPEVHLDKKQKQFKPLLRVCSFKYTITLSSIVDLIRGVTFTSINCR